MSAPKGVTYPLGFRAAGAACGLKKNGAADVALVVSDQEAAAAGIFTRNIVKGHSLQLCQRQPLRCRCLLRQLVLRRSCTRLASGACACLC